MKVAAGLAAALATMAFSAAADVTVMSWGGEYGRAQTKAHVIPFASRTGIPTRMVDSDNLALSIRAMVEVGNVTVNVASVEYSDAIRLCRDGLLEPIDFTDLPPGNDGTPATEDFLDGAVTDCGVSTDIWSTVFAFNYLMLPGTVPSTAADFFDLDKFPGRRGLRRDPKSVLEFALLADGVSPSEVYEVLNSPSGVDRAFEKLDTIKAETIFWETGGQPAQLLEAGEVVMTTAYNPRMFVAVVVDRKPFRIVWDGQIWENDMYVVPKGAPNKDQAIEFIAYATSTEGLRAQTQQIPFGPSRRSSMADELIYKDGRTVMAPLLPTYPENLANGLASNVVFWVAKEAELNERFNTWLATN